MYSARVQPYSGITPEPSFYVEKFQQKADTNYSSNYPYPPVNLELSVGPTTNSNTKFKSTFPKILPTAIK